MVFESIVTELLNKYLGEYVENLDSSQLSIGIWGGDVVLTDLSLKQSALDDLNLPVKTVYGHLGKLVLKIPWKNLYTAPTQVLIERLFLLAVPNQEIKYDPVKEEKWKQEEKQAEIERVEAAKRRELEKDLPKADDTFTEKLVAQIVRNVQITITDIHIRYEDRVSCPTKPFSFGITLHNLAVITTDRKWVPSINQTRTGHIFKHLTIDGLSVYLNSKSELFCSIKNEKLLLKAFKEGIPKAGTLVLGYKYMVGPISSTAKLQLNMNPEQDKYKIPKAILQLQLKIVHIRISKFQYCDIVALLESLDRMARASVYRKYRPNVKEYRGHYKIWWKYAYTCILEEEVRRKRKNWNWLHIKTHREVCHEYADAYQTKLTSHDKSCFPVIKKCETVLDAFNIVLIRQRIEVEVEREGRLKEQTASQKGWFSGWWSSKEDTPADDKVNFKKQFQEAMTSSEKEKLFKAIDYQENLIPANYPAEFVEADVQFTLESLEIIVRDDDLPKPEVMIIHFKHVSLHCEERPTASALKFAVQMYEFSITGLEQNNTNPMLCDCLEQLDANKKYVPLIKALFETSPLDGTCDTRVHIECRPLRIIYDAQTVNQLIDIFTPEEDKSSVIHQLQMAANMKLAEMKEKSAVGLQYAIQQHSRLELKINLMASYIIVPHSGFYTDDLPLLVWNLGSFSIESVAKGDSVSVKAMHKSGAREQEIMERVISESYDKFILKIENMQIMLAHPGEPWMKHFENSDDCELHLLHPTTLNVELQKCLITDDPRLPKLKINGTLPNITLRIQEDRLFDTISLLLSIPFSEKKTVKPQSGLDDQLSAPYLYGSSSSLFKFDTVSELASKRARKKSIIVTGEEEILQFTDLEANFQLNEVVIEILRHQRNVKNIPFLTLNVITVEAGMVIQTFNMNVHFRVGGLSGIQTYKKHEVIRLITSPLASGENDYLLVFKYQNVDRNSPDFHSYYKSVLQLIDVDFSKLHFIVHQEALMQLIQWCNEIYCLFDLQKVVPPKEVPSNVSQRQSSQLHLPTILESVSFSKTAKKGKKKPVETIDLKLRATMSEIGVTLVNRRFKLARMEIAGGVASIIMKRSYTQVDAKLSDLQVIDFKESFHPKILSIVGKEELMTFQLVIFNEELQRKSENVNMSLTASVACIRVVFLNRFVKDLMNFLNNFQMAQEAIKEASAAAAEAAKVNMQQAYSAALKISFNISLKAPLIIVPVFSLSNDAIAIDFGNLTITNSFQDVVVRDNDDHVAVLDNLRLCLENVKVSRILSDGEVNKNEKNLLDPITFQLFVQRNLSSAWFTDKPDLDVGGHLGSIYLKLSKDDSLLIMTILNKNFAEGNEPQAAVVTVDSYDKVRPVASFSKKSTTSTKTASDIQSVLSDKPAPVVRSGKGDHEVYTIIKFTLRLESIIIELFENHRKSVGKGSINLGQALSPEKEISLSRLKVNLLSLKGSLLSDDTYTFSALLLDFLIDDTRPSQEKKINRYMERVPIVQDKSMSPDSTSYQQKSMIDITVRLKDNSLFVDLRVFSFLLILNLQYLMKLAEFFTIDDSKQEVVTVDQRGAASITSIATEHSIRNMQKRSTAEGMTVINICIEQPDIILVENLDDINTNALILEMQITMKLRLLSNLHQVISGTVKDLQLFTCCYNPARRHQTKSQVLRHVTINLAGSTPVNKGLHLDLCTTDIHFSVTPDTIELLNSCYQTLYSEMGNTTEDEIGNEDYSDAWEISKYDNSDFWFLRSEQGTEALEALDMDFSESEGLSEICLVSIPSIVITLEAGIGTHTMPLLLLDSCVKGTVNNWSSQLTAEMQITLQVGYFNSRCAMWEPLVEPVEVISHGLSSKHPWELSLKLEKRENLKKGSLDSDDSSEDKAPITAITITSEETMEISISKTCLHVLQSLGTAFNDALYKPHAKSMTPQAPYVVKNETGLPIKVKLSDVPFQVLGDTSNIKEVLVEAGAEVNLCLLENPLLASVVHFTTAVETAAVETFIVVSIEDDDFELEIPVSRAEKRYFSIKGNNSQEQQGLISDVAVNYGSVIVTLCSIIRVYNHFQEEISVFFMTNKGDEIQLVGCVQPDSYLNLPFNAVYTPTGELFFSVPGHAFSVTPYVWKELRNTLSLTELLQCNSKNVEDNEPFFIKAVGDMEQVYFELSNRYTMSSTCYNIHLRPTVILKNFLPVDCIACIQGVATERLLNSGDRMVLPTVEPGSSSITIRISGYLDKEWSCKRAISESPPELEVWTFESYDSPQRVTFDLGMHSVNKHGSLILALYCPFWMLNKTGLSLCYRRSTKPDRSDDSTIPTEQADDMSNILYHPETYTEPVMFSFRAKYFFGKKKACIRVQNGEWSEKFSLDVAGSFGVVNCKVKDETYQVGVHIELCYNTLTKQVTFTPYHIIVNQCSRPINFCEVGTWTKWLKVDEESCLPFWPATQNKEMVVRFDGTVEESVPFPFSTIHDSLLKLENKYGGIDVNVQMTEGAIYVTFSDFKIELAASLLINHINEDLVVEEKNSGLTFTLPRSHKKLFCWSNFSDGKQLTWGGGKYASDLYKDDIGEFKINDSTKGFYVSFLDGMQRILLFTTDIMIAHEAQNANIIETFDQEMTFSIHGLGISLVDNIKQHEILYLGITSSGIVWESSAKITKRFKPLAEGLSNALEDCYQSYLQEKMLGKDNPVKVVGDKTVDFENLVFVKPSTRYLKRTYRTGLWLQMRTSSHQFQLHARVNRLQIDNQMYSCVFPVILAPVPPPKTVSNASAFKPFAEVSIVEMRNQHTTVVQYKYFKVLIQEFHIKVDVGFINAIVDYFEAGEISDTLEASQFQIDRQLVEKQLKDHVSNLSSQQQKNFYDFLHFSPLKIHLSFSLSGGGHSGLTGLPPIVSVVTQSLGVTLTDMQDVVFKLSYFERQYTFLSRRQLINEVQMHYIGQLFKQAYVLVFGLDVLGNPYGLVIGFKQGVEDLFYEPFQGAIQGPGEFAEGFYLGVRSLVGHTIGGAAGAMSRITGAMGKGLAALTFDEEYQRKRREQMNVASTSLPESMAQSGKGLVMGVVHGVGGVFMKPITGAKEEGVEGFFKGVGKGMVGLITRPTAGAVDFASGTFSSVRKIAQMSEEVLRMRSPRHFKVDRILRPYSRQEAEGQKLLLEVDKGRLQATDLYAYHTPIGHKDILLLTDKRIAYLVNDVFGGYQIDWSYTWEEIGGVLPRIAGNSIVLTVTEPRKTFFKTVASKKVLIIPDVEQRKVVLSKITQCMSPKKGSLRNSISSSVSGSI